MKKKLGFNHIDLATKNMAATRAFYEGILGFPVVRHDRVTREGSDGYSEHVFFDCGGGQMIAFASAEHAPGRWPEDLDTGINKGLGLPGATYHFAFEAGSLENLIALKEELEAKGVAFDELFELCVSETTAALTAATPVPAVPLTAVRFGDTA